MSDDFGDSMMRGVARLMVRRHLSDLVQDGVGTEDELSAALLAWLGRNRSVSMKDAAFRFRLDVLAALSKPSQVTPSISIKTLGES